MKSINVKKIATIAAGAALLGTAFAGAAVTVDEGLGNFVPTLYSNGEPNVQVVIGSNGAEPTDALAAANIAAMLGSKAYTMVETEAAEPAAGTTVAPVSVTVVTAANAVPAGTYGFTSFWGDDDVDNGADNTYNRTASAPGYNGNLAPTKEVSSTTTSLVHDYSVDTKGKYTSTITAREFVNLAGSADYSTSSDKYVLRTPRAWYSQTFSPGLPACLDTTQTLEACTTNNRLDRAGIHLTFLGTDYLVSSIVMGSASANGWNPFNSMTLSKASVDQVVSSGSTLTSPEGYSVEVQSISAPQTTASVSSVALLVRSPSNTTESLTVTAGAAPTKVLGSVYVQVPDAFYTATGTSTARVIFSTGSVRMVQNATIDELVYGKWQVSFTTNNVSTSQSISRLQIGNDFQPGTLEAGQGLDIITGAPGYRWTFQGSTLLAADYTSLTVEPVPLDSVLIDGNTTSCSFSAIKFTSSRNDAFRIGSDQESTVWFLVKNRTTDASGACNKNLGQWIFQNSTSVYAVTNGTAAPATTLNCGVSCSGDTGLTAGITFFYPGSGTDDRVTINLSTNTGKWNFTTGVGSANLSLGNATYINVTIPEILNESTSTTEGSWLIPMVYGSGVAGGSSTATDLTVRDAVGLTTSGKVNYSVPARVAADQAAAYFGDAPLYSPRGSYVSSSPTTNQYILNYASKLGKAQYVLSTQGTNLSSGTSTVSCTPGTPCSVGGQTITIPSGTAAGTTSSQAVAINTGVRPLVVLDSDASSTQPLIVVGGPFVNSVAASMEAASAFDTCDPSVGGDGVVQIEGNKVLVAGCSAADTQEAARELISFLAEWTPN